MQFQKGPADHPVSGFIIKDDEDDALTAKRIRYSRPENLEKVRDRSQLILDKYGDGFFLFWISFLKSYEDSYELSDSILEACGYYVEILNWDKIVKIGEKYPGDLPPNPHISLVYRNNFKELLEYYKTIKPLEIKSEKYSVKLCLVDITIDNPSKWTILK